MVPMPQHSPTHFASLVTLMLPQDGQMDGLLLRRGSDVCSQKATSGGGGGGEYYHHRCIGSISELRVPWVREEEEENGLDNQRGTHEPREQLWHGGGAPRLVTCCAMYSEAVELLRNSCKLYLTTDCSCDSCKRKLNSRSSTTRIKYHQ